MTRRFLALMAATVATCLLLGLSGCAADAMVRALDSAGNDHASVTIETTVPTPFGAFVQRITRANPYPPTTAPVRP